MRWSALSRRTKKRKRPLMRYALFSRFKSRYVATAKVVCCPPKNWCRAICWCMPSSAATCTIQCSTFTGCWQAAGRAGDPAAYSMSIGFCPVAVHAGELRHYCYRRGFWLKIIAVALRVFILVEIENFCSACSCPKRRSWKAKNEQERLISFAGSS